MHNIVSGRYMDDGVPGAGSESPVPWVSFFDSFLLIYPVLGKTFTNIFTF